MSSNKNKIIFLSVFLFSIFYFLFSTPVLAAELKYTFPCSPIAGGTCPTAEQAAESPAAYIARFYQFALMIAGALAFAMIIYGAIQYIVSAGNATTQKDAADRIFQALWGIALLLGAWLILYTIDPKLVSLTDPKIDILKVTETEYKQTIEDITQITKEEILPQLTIEQLRSEQKNAEERINAYKEKIAKTSDKKLLIEYTDSIHVQETNLKMIEQEISEREAK